MTNRPKAV